MCQIWVLWEVNCGCGMVMGCHKPPFVAVQVDLVGGA